MPISSLPAAILSHMISVNNVPPPSLRSIPNLKVSKHIDYGQLNTLCHLRGIQYNQTSSPYISAHDDFMKQYPKIFVKKRHRLPELLKLEGKRKPAENIEETQLQQPTDDSHNVAVHIKKIHGDILYGPKKFEEKKLAEFLAILKKLPIHRTRQEHNTVWRMLRTIPELTSQLTDEHLKTLSMSVISEKWLKGSIVFGNDGFYIILKGMARPQTMEHRSFIEENKSPTSFTPQGFHGILLGEELKHTPLAVMFLSPCEPVLTRWSTFGTLEDTPQTESEARKYSVVAEEDCEILRISAKELAKLKLEKKKLENKEKVKLIRSCPYYEEWPTLSIYELIALIKWKKFPPGHVIVESGNIISFVAYINSGYCEVYRTIVGLVKQQSKVKKIRKFVYMGKLMEKESFGEISVLLQVPFTCTVVTGNEVELAIIEDKDLFKIDPVTKQLMLQTAQPTFGHLTDDNAVKNSLYYNGIVPGFGKWNHYWTSIPRNFKDTLITY
ncbi:cyclic nucleotide-binding domain-containing protein 1 isoform X2 [Talpa occidentalis]|uniref:cyclic nucleotide-binding domain-containing protein 1 isoform X2 n=1 Tax=Talpa occidentalis TaxID=50954 RepID=UPI0023F9B504|nr:cyclic nucleotide-binding domain-containing protein 1 isoform X2 [Talpa occidentalis]